MNDRRDAGESLIEVMVAIVIIGLLVSTAVIIFTTMLATTREYRIEASLDATLHNDVAAVLTQIQEGPASDYAPCATPSMYNAGGSNALTLDSSYSDITSSVTAVTYWNGTAFQSTCPASTGQPEPEQLTLTATDSDNNQNQSATIAVDDPGLPIARLVFVQQPTTIYSLTPFSPTVQVAVEDAFGDVIVNDTSTMTMSLTPIADTNGGVIQSCSGTESQGVFSFPTCTVQGGGEYELVATDGVTASSATFNSIDQLDTPVVTSVAPSGSLSGTVNLTYTPSLNAPANQIYTGLACFDEETNVDCIKVTPFASGDAISGLAPGQSYYVSVEADGSADYLDAKSTGAGPVTTSLQAQAPQITGVTSGTNALTVTFSEASAASSPTFSAKACTDAAMSQGCVTVSNFTSGGVISGLTAANYYVTVTMANQTGYIGATSAVYGPVAS